LSPTVAAFAPEFIVENGKTNTKNARMAIFNMNVSLAYCSETM